MNHGPSDARAFMRAFLTNYAKHTDRDVIFFPSAVSLAAMVESLRDRHDVRVGVQNIHWEDKGAFTGEVSGSMARDAGAHYVLIGHSERRHVFGETDDEAGHKLAAALRCGLIPMLCVGELLAEREAGQTNAVVVRQLRAGLAHADSAKLAHFMIAYEPVWAIGTGMTATPADASAVHEVIRGELRALIAEKAGGVHILYGGSVNRGNAAQLLAAPGIEGLLVGGASLDAEGWSSIVRT
jgi:triosephosphate isomerase